MLHWPSFLTNKVRPTCETVNLPLGSEFFTNQTALTYTLTDVWQPDDEGGSGAGYGIAPSLTYYNNVLENCSVNSVEIDYASLDRTASQFAYSQWGAVVRTYATCSIVGVNGTTNLNLTQEYDYVPSSASFSTLYRFLGSDFLSRNKTDKASLWWGESLMSMYWAYSGWEMQNIQKNKTQYNEAGVRKGTLYFYPNDDTVITNLTNQDFFECDFRYIVDEGRGNFTLIQPSSYGQYEEYTDISNLIAQNVYPNIWQSADILAKSAYSTVLTDLGQVSAASNILTDPDMLRYFTTNFTETKRNIENAYPGPGDRPYGTEDTGPLGTTPSMISTKYLCQVPQRKSGGNLFVAIVVADLVFLQALWFLFKVGVDAFMLRRRPGTNHCAGCTDPPPTSLAAGMYNRDMYSRDVSPEPSAAYADKDGGAMEMGGLRPTARPRTREGSPHSRSVSQQRLLEPMSIDLGHRV